MFETKVVAKKGKKGAKKRAKKAKSPSQEVAASIDMSTKSVKVVLDKDFVDNYFKEVNAVDVNWLKTFRSSL